LTIEERKKLIAEFEKSHYQLSTLLKERLLITTDERFNHKLEEMAYYSMNGSVYQFAK
jgi:hypothetical protein